jgi:ubiquinone/menaquinone biosynthesis C-methylase UbiE
MGAESVLDVGCGTGRARPANAEEVDTPAGRVRMAHEVNSVEGEIVRFMTTYTRLRLGRARGEQYGDWDRSPLTEQSPEIITLARR